MIIWCCECDKAVEARLTDGTEIYPHRHDLNLLPFWKCDYCNNYVGCHHKTEQRTKPLGCIPTSGMRSIRSDIHQVLDPIWKSGRITRKKAYARLSKMLGRKYHTGSIKSAEEARHVLTLVIELERRINNGYYM